MTLDNSEQVTVLRGTGRRRAAIRVLIAMAVLVTSAIVYLGFVRPRRDELRMDSLSASVLAEIQSGMSAREAIRVLDRYGLEHSEVVSTAEDSDSLESEKGVIYSMIRHKVQPWSFVFRDVQVRVYLDADRIVGRVKARDVFTGP
jgi:hypothetical protein